MLPFEIKRASIKLPKQIVVCVKNDGCDDLSLHTVYELLPDADAEEIQYRRIIDDSGEDYLYPALYFLPVDLSEPLQHLILDAVPIGIE